MRRAAKLADEGYAVFREAARVGRADYELIAEIEAFFRANGVDHNFQIIGVGGPGGARHGAADRASGSSAATW